MNEAIALSWVYLASALSLAADRRYGARRWISIDTPRKAFVSRLAAVLLVLAAGVSWRSSEPGPAAFIAVPLALMACCSFVTLLAPIGPRLVWGLAVTALPFSLLLAAFGGPHG
jgi:hypothetical protein